MNLPDKIPDSPPTADQRIPPPILDYARPRESLRQANGRLVFPAAAGFGTAIFIYCLGYTVIMRWLDRANHPRGDLIDAGTVISYLVFALYAAGVTGAFCRGWASTPTVRLERRKSAGWLGAAIYVAPQTIADLLDTAGLHSIQVLGIFIMAWMLIFPWVFWRFLLRPADSSEEQSE